MRYTYCCPTCGYLANNPQFMRMRNNPDGHICFPVHYDDREEYGLTEEDYYDD